MALVPETASSTDSNPIEDSGQHIDAPALKYFVFALFFIFGGITSLNDVIIPKLKELFTLNYTQAMLVQFCFFGAYAIMGIPAAKLIKKVGYMRGAVTGLLLMMFGCLLFIPASQTATYILFLFALFVLASGVVVIQVVANPLISLLGPPATAHSRLTFAQAFNSLGTTIFPIVGSVVILGTLADVSAAELSGLALVAYQRAESEALWKGYLGLAAGIGIVALVVWMFRNLLRGEKHDASSTIMGLGLLSRPRFAYGALCIFLYVGAEVSIGSVVINYLMQERVFGEPESVVGWMIGLYWGGAMVGRFVGSALLRVFRPGKVLAFNAAGAIVLILISSNTSGAVAGYSLLAIGLMNSVMFPTIFSLACEKLGPRTADGSGILNVAICGGAIVPLAFGALADSTGSLALALILPAACYAVIGGFGLYARRPA